MIAQIRTLPKLDSHQRLGFHCEIMAFGSRGPKTPTNKLFPKQQMRGDDRELPAYTGRLANLGVHLLRLRGASSDLALDKHLLGRLRKASNRFGLEPLLLGNSDI
jgi:hypothetical protein